VKPLASAAIDVAKTKAGQAYSFAKSKAGDAATWMSETSDSVVGGLAGAANWMYSGAAGFFRRGRGIGPSNAANNAAAFARYKDELRRQEVLNIDGTGSTQSSFILTSSPQLQKLFDEC